MNEYVQHCHPILNLEQTNERIDVNSSNIAIQTIERKRYTKRDCVRVRSFEFRYFVKLPYFLTFIRFWFHREGNYLKNSLIFISEKNGFEYSEWTNGMNFCFEKTENWFRKRVECCFGSVIRVIDKLKNWLGSFGFLVKRKRHWKRVEIKSKFHFSQTQRFGFVTRKSLCKTNTSKCFDVVIRSSFTPCSVFVQVKFAYI